MFVVLLGPAGKALRRLHNTLGQYANSSCIANAYSDNHDTIAAPDTGFLHGLALYVVDALALVHALILRVQALVLPFQKPGIQRTLRSA